MNVNRCSDVFQLSQNPHFFKYTTISQITGYTHYHKVAGPNKIVRAIFISNTGILYTTLTSVKLPAASHQKNHAALPSATIQPDCEISSLGSWQICSSLSL